MRIRRRRFLTKGSGFPPRLFAEFACYYWTGGRILKKKIHFAMMALETG